MVTISRLYLLDISGYKYLQANNISFNALQGKNLDTKDGTKTD